jgi:hypothetical protein
LAVPTLVRGLRVVVELCDLVIPEEAFYPKQLAKVHDFIGA